MAFTDERFESTRAHAFLEDGNERIVSDRIGRLRRRVVSGGTRVGVATREQSIGQLVKLTVQAVGGKGHGTRPSVIRCGRQISVTERRKGEDGLHDGCHIATVAQV